MYTGTHIRWLTEQKSLLAVKGEIKDGYGVGSVCSAAGYYIKKYWIIRVIHTLYSGLNPVQFVMLIFY